MELIKIPMEGGDEGDDEKNRRAIVEARTVYNTSRKWWVVQKFSRVR